MNRIRLILRNLRFYRKPYLSVLAGVAVSTAVLTGALIVGDSVRFSLHRLTDLRLGKIRYALQSNDRFFRQELAGSLSQDSPFQIVPVLQSEGIAINSDKELRINQVQVLGIDKGFGKFWDPEVSAPGIDSTVISRNVADRLQLKPGDDLLLRIQNQSKAPSNAPFVPEKTPSVSIRVRISEVTDDEKMGRFSLKSNQAAPYNIFLSLKQMASLMKLTGYANILLAKGDDGQVSMIQLVDGLIAKSWKPADAGLTFRKLPVDRMYEIISDRIFFDDSVARAVLTTIPGSEPILTYLVNEISCGKKSTPYSFVTAASESFLGQPIGNGQILINDWLAKDLGIGAGDSVRLRYFLMGPLRSLREDSIKVLVKGIVPLSGSLSDPGLMPDFPGMTGKGNCRDWETGAPVDLKRIRDKDEQYWNDHRGTPKAFIALTTGQKIWDNRFGHCTAIRFKATEKDIPGIEKALMSVIKPRHLRLNFEAVYEQGQTAARNSTDFGELFLSLSFFILLSGLMLTSMLFYLHARMRGAESGILSAIGFRKHQILGILSGEAMAVVIVGAAAGICGGILYNYFLILGLNTIWQDAVNTSLLVMQVRPLTLLTGASAGILTSLAALLIIARKNLRKPMSVLIKNGAGIPTAGLWPGKKHRKAIVRGTIILAILFIGISITVPGWLVIQHKTINGTLLLITGGLMLFSELALANLFLARSAQHTGNGLPRLMRLSLKNLALHRVRTMSAIALLSIGTFTIIITGANRKTLYGGDATRKSGTGGFLLWAESTLPIMNDLNTRHGAGSFELQDEPLLKPVRFIQLPQLDGDDASCLNLNQVSQPGLLGIPANLFDKLNVFNVMNPGTETDQAHPWKTLSESLAPGVIPGFADQTVITWGLRKSVGDTLVYRDESGGILKIKLAGGLDNSIFQGKILVSDSLLRQFFPSMSGSRIMLIDAPGHSQDTLAQELETLFRDYGLTATPATVRLAAFNAVENAYLSVFMLLGGLGVIIGTVGLGIVLVRNLTLRKHEIALYVALGFRKRYIFRLVVAEHLLILVSSLLLGLISALPGILTMLAVPAFRDSLLLLAGILMLVLINGFLWIFFAARSILSGDLLPGLRTE